MGEYADNCGAGREEMGVAAGEGDDPALGEGGHQPRCIAGRNAEDGLAGALGRAQAGQPHPNPCGNGTVSRSTGVDWIDGFHRNAKSKWAKGITSPN